MVIAGIDLRADEAIDHATPGENESAASRRRSACRPIGLFMSKLPLRPSPILAIRDVVAEVFRHSMPAAVQKFGRAIKPIYCAKENGRATHLGTCILVNRNNGRFLLTAAHVIDVRDQSQLLIPIHGKLKPLQGSGFMTTPPAGGRRLDRFDFAVIALGPAFVQALGDVPYVTDADLAPNLMDTFGRMYVALGYPNSRNDRNIDHRKLQIRPAPFTYGATAIQDAAFARKLAVSGNDHFFLQYSKRSRDVNGAVVRSIDPHGMSGGALIDVAKASMTTLAGNPAPSTFRLAGLLIEIHKKDQRMVAIKIDTVMRAIDDAIREGKMHQRERSDI